MKTSKSWYMHTIDGKPAVFHERYRQICYAMKRQNCPILVGSLAEIREHQRKTIAYRLSLGLKVDPGEYGYITFPKVTVKRSARPQRRK